jgi:hypothetical protein
MFYLDTKHKADMKWKHEALRSDEQGLDVMCFFRIEQDWDLCRMRKL